MITGKYYEGEDERAADALDVRMDVFVKELGFPEEEEVDGSDIESLHAVVYSDDEPIATGRLFIGDDENFHMGRIAVKKAYRGQGIGDLVVRMLLSRARDFGADKVHISAVERVKGFYVRYGFEETGDAYPECGVPHRHMFITADKLSSVVYCENSCGGNCSECDACKH